LLENRALFALNLRTKESLNLIQLLQEPTQVLEVQTRQQEEKERPKQQQEQQIVQVELKAPEEVKEDCVNS